MGFKVFEVTAANKEQAKEKVMAMNCFVPQTEVTQSFTNWKKTQNLETLSEKDITDWMTNLLQTKSKNQKGLGYFITVTSAIQDTRRRPYHFDDVKNEKGKREWETVIALIDVASNQVLDIVSGPKLKSRAKKRTQELIIEGKSTNIAGKYIKQTKKGSEPIAFYAKKVPSKNARPGVYKFFGITRD